MSQHSHLPPLSAIPATLQTVADYEQQAQQHLSEVAWHYLQGGAMQEIS
ncbi:MAG: alpha-hydroxy-acid oxidizing protein, partial [Acinetobacter sp.]